MNIASLRARVRSLRRRMARPYAQVMLQRQADDLCTQWAVAQADKQPTPSPQAFVRRVAAAGFRLSTFTGVVRYLERCAGLRQEPSQEPTPELLLRALLPWAEYHPGVTLPPKPPVWPRATARATG